jgi:hypothetical protein
MPAAGRETLEQTGIGGGFVQVKLLRIELARTP